MLSSAARLTGLAAAPGGLGAGCRGWQSAGGGVYLLVARKMVVGLRPLRPARREPMGKLLPLPLAKVNRSAASPDTDKH